jgi:chromosome segregation protein
MRLAKLTLCGFKSFADKTEFSFDDDITGIVGPNGCGKSNVVDAIKWVLGERSSKSLRGKEMIDVIFAGSAGRKPGGLASVTLTFENPVINADAEMQELQYGDHVPGVEELGEIRPAQGGAGFQPATEEPTPAPSTQHAASESSPPHLPAAPPPHASKRRALPIDADIVEVERRLYRDGTSKYLINGRNARLKDIRDLFLDTGIGADAYSIIEQGKVDAMLLASPQERRTIFEEAAGIAKYKQRRIEAQRKLERAQANLTVTREQLAGTERRLRIVKGQAVKARRFRELDGDLRAWRTALAFDQYDDVRQRLEGFTSRIAELEGVRKEAIDRLAHIESAKQEAEIARHELQQKHRALQDQHTAARHAEHSASQRKSMTERALDDAQRQSASDEQRLASLDQRIAGLTSAAQEQHQLIAAASERLADAERQLETASTQRAGLLEQRASKQSALAERRAAAANIDRERNSLLASVEGDKRREETLRDQLKKNDERRATLAADRQQRESAIASGRETTASRKQRIAELEADLRDRESAAANLSQGRRELASRVSTLEQNVLRLDSRRHTLQEMVESRVGLGDAARAVLAAKEQGSGFAGVIAPLADLIETDREHAGAVEAALGATLQALVIPTIADMPAPEDLATLPGRVTFVPLAGLADRGPEVTPAHRWREDPIDPALIDSHRVIPLRAVVRDLDGSIPHAPMASSSSTLLDRLLASTYLVESIDAALMLAAAHPGARFVTRDGAVMEPDGRITAGPANTSGSESAGILQRRSELAELEAELARLSASLEHERRALRAVDAEAAALAHQQADLRSRLSTEQRTLVGEQARIDQLVSELSRLERDGRNLDDEAQQLSARIAKLEEDRARLLERAARLQGLHDEQSAAAAALDQELQSFASRVEAANEQITALRVETSRLSEQLNSARREHRRLEGAAEAAEREQADLQRLVAQSRARLQEHQNTIAEAAAQIEQHAAEARRLDGLVAEAAEEMQQAEKSVLELSEAVNAARAQAQHIERDWHSLEVARRELEVKREALEERTTQELELDLAWEYPEYRRLFAEDSGVTILRIDQSEAQSAIDILRDEIRKLGNVNMEALEEETQLEARNEELIRQVADIDDAARKLAELIDTLNTASRQRFEEVFTRIQEHFAGNNGMFRKLFGGGSAEVRLMPLIKEVETPEGIKKVETDEYDVLESGIEVIAKPPGKQPRSINQLSGGEKTLTAVALLLAIFQSKPSCFCILDEVDAALDEGNVGRYCGVIREFTTHSHFIVITHNKKTMAAADRLYGVTMQERGVSTRVSVKFDQVGKDGAINAAAPASSSGAPIAGDEAEPPDQPAPAPRKRKPTLPEMAPEPDPAKDQPSRDGRIADSAPVVSPEPPAAAPAPDARSGPKPTPRDLLRRALAGMTEEASQSQNS